MAPEQLTTSLFFRYLVLLISLPVIFGFFTIKLSSKILNFESNSKKALITSLLSLLVAFVFARLLILLPDLGIYIYPLGHPISVLYTAYGEYRLKRKEFVILTFSIIAGHWLAFGLLKYYFGIDFRVFLTTCPARILS